MPVIIGLENPKSPTNVGSALRAIRCFDADSVRFSGTRLTLALQYATDTKDFALTAPPQAVDDLLDDLPNQVKVVAFELCEGAEPLSQFHHPKDCLYCFGPEDGTLSQAIIDRADHVVFVPTVGCMNLAASVNVVLYDRLSKTTELPADLDAHIRRQRDTNNRVKQR